MWTKESITEFVDNLLWWKNKEVKEETEKLSIQIGNVGYDTGPNQSDKPSAHSSLTMTEIKQGFNGYWKKKGYTYFTVANTNSMEPWIDENCIVGVETLNEQRLAKQPISVGDVVIYKRVWNNALQLVIHRVTMLDNEGKKFYIKGDNNYFSDGWIKIEDVKYRMFQITYAQQIRQGD